MTDQQKPIATVIVVEKLNPEDILTKDDLLGFIEDKKPSLVPITCVIGMKIKDITFYFAKDPIFQGFYRKKPATPKYQ